MRDGHISLADRSGNSLARQPLFASNLLLPVSRWDDSEPLGWKLDAGRAAEAKQFRIGGDGIDPHSLAGGIKKHIARLHQRLGHVHQPMPPSLPVPVEA